MTQSLKVVPSHEDDVVKFGGENIFGDFGKLTHYMNLSDELLQIMDVIKNIFHELDGVGLAIGLAGTLHHFSIWALSKECIDEVVPLDEGPEVSLLLVFLRDFFHTF